MASSRAGGLYLGVLLILVAAGAAASAQVAWTSAAGERRLWGLRLGLTAQGVRRQFELAGSGSWAANPGDELTIEWRSSDPESSPSRVIFEFHQALLVAVRARVSATDPQLPVESLEVTPVSVLSRGASDGRWVELTLLARDCPAHSAEVHRLLDSRPAVGSPGARRDGDRDVQYRAGLLGPFVTPEYAVEDIERCVETK